MIRVLLVGLICVGCSKPVDTKPSPEDAKKQIDEATAFFKNGAKKEAITALTKLLSSDENNSEARLLRAQYHANTGSKSDSLNDYGYYITKNGDKYDVLTEMASIVKIGEDPSNIKARQDALGYMMRAFKCAKTDREKEYVRSSCRQMYLNEHIKHPEMKKLFDTTIDGMVELGVRKGVTALFLDTAMTSMSLDVAHCALEMQRIILEGGGESVVLAKAKDLSEKLQKDILKHLNELK